MIHNFMKELFKSLSLWSLKAWQDFWRCYDVTEVGTLTANLKKWVGFFRFIGGCELHYVRYAMVKPMEFMTVWLIISGVSLLVLMYIRPAMSPNTTGDIVYGPW